MADSLVSNASSQCLVESSVCLNLVPFTASEEASLVGMFIVVLSLQLNLQIDGLKSFLYELDVHILSPVCPGDMERGYQPTCVCNVM